MTIAVSILFLVSVFVFALVASNGLPETMRSTALWLLVRARRMDEWRAKRDGKVREALARETVIGRES